MKQFNKSLIAPISAIVVIVAKDLLNLELETQAIESAITVILGIVTAIGFKLSWYK